MIAALRFVEPVPTGENDVGVGEQQTFAPHEIGMSEPELRKLVHTVVDDSDFSESPEHCWGSERAVEPLHRIIEHSLELAAGRDRALDQRARFGDSALDVVAQRSRKSGNGAEDVGVGNADVQSWR